MEAESLNIKLKLDLSSVTSGVTKVKKQLTGMAKSVKDSIPHISKEGNKASKSLNDVSTASSKAKKAIGDIGKEAKSSLSAVSAESSKVINKLNAINVAKKNSSSFGSSHISEGADSASDSLQGLQSTLDSIRNLSVLELLSSQLDNIKEKAKSFKKTIKDLFELPKGNKYIIDLLKKMGAEEKDLTMISKALNKEMIKVFINDLGEAIKKITVFIGKLTALVSVIGLLVIAKWGSSIADNTKEFREEQTKLNSAFVAAGASAKEASQAYNGLFRFLGKSDVAVEAANHLAKITTNTKALAEWTTIAQGIYATFGDSLPIEGLTEAANESIRVSKVTGVLADALNWAGVSEDDFNAALAQTNSLAEREVLLRSTLNGLYQNAAQIYEQNNRRIIEQNEAQARLNATMARIGQQTQVLSTAWINLKSVVLSVLAPAIIYVSTVFSVLIDKIASAIKWLGALVGISFDVENISSAVGGVTANINNATGSVGGLTDSLNGASAAAQKLKRTTMGFDELNVIPKPDTSSGGAGASAGGGGGLTGLDTGNGVISKMGEQIEDVKTKVEAFFDKWKTQIAIIGTALGALSIAKLLTGLGKVLGLGNKFLATMNTIKKLAATAITITLQYTLVNEFMDKYIDGQGFKEYLKGLLVSALGTGVLYAMWGPAGLAIGLGVTAVASIKSVIDNGGIDSTESAIVALTGLASAIGAIGVAFKKLNLGTILPAIGTAIKTHMTKIGIVISGALSSISGVVSTVLSGIKIAVSAATSFIMANPIVLIIAAIVALVALIATKGDEIKAILNKVSNWLKSVFCKDWREVFGNTIGTVLNGFVKIVGDIMGNAKKMLNGIIDFIRGVFTGNWKRAWQGIKDIFSGAFGGLKSVAKAPINGIIALINGALSAITSGINAVKRALNKISVDIPSWVPGFGGKKFGFNFSMSSAPKIPMLANGGIATRSTIANIGEAGREAVLPLDRNTEWMNTLVDKIAARQQPQKVVLQVGEKELGWATIGAINGITKQTGTLQLTFA